MGRRPVIGLNMSLETGKRSAGDELRVPLHYVDAVISAGGIPVCLPPAERDAWPDAVLSRLDGVLLIGGDDYLPGHYGGHPQPQGELMPERRDRFDMMFARWGLDETDLPVLGICGGHQLLSLVQGGALVQDIRTEWVPPEGQATLPHSGRERRGVMKRRFRHLVCMEPGSLAARVTGTEPGSMLSANSFHHQAVAPHRIGRDLCATAWAPDGVVEAIEPAPGSTWAKSGRFILGVQWHPEQLSSDKPHHHIFAALIAAAAK